MSLKQQVILITGAGGGLGSVAALTLAKNGAHIILLDKNIAKLEVVYDAILAANAPEPIIYPFDLAGANENEYQDLANKIDELAKRIDEFAVNSFAALTIGSSQKPAGITIYDEVTGDPYCMSVKNGNMVTKFGACGDSVQEQEVGDSNDTPPAISNFNQNIELEPEQDIEFNNGTSSEESVESAQEQVEIIEDVETSEPEVEIEVEPQQVQEEEVSQEAEIIVETNQSSGSVDLPVE